VLTNEADGVKNMISCYDFSSRAPTVSAMADLEVSKDDSVTCIANLATKEGLIVFAGNGESVAEKALGRDMSFKAFEVQLPKSAGEKKEDGKIAFLSKTQILTAPQAESAKKEAYIRLMRVSASARLRRASRGKRTRLSCLARRRIGRRQRIS
jgi:prolactin regulatory element-binding protein